MPLHRSLLRPILVILLGVCLGISASGSAAQTAALDVIQAAEYDIGFDCPVSAALAPGAARLWVLMDDCYDSHFSLRAFSVVDGSPLNDDTSDFSDELAVLDEGYITHFTFPVAFTPDGMLDILYSDSESYDTLNLRVPVDAAETADTRALLPTLDALNALIPGFTGYPETTVYNADHTLAAVIDETHFYVLDLLAGVRLLEIEQPGEPYSSFPYFSTDSHLLYITQLHNPEDYDDYTSTLYVFSLPDGEQRASYEVPSPFIWVSPNDQYVAMQVGDETLQVLDLVSGGLSVALPLFEPPTKVMRCLNNNADVSDIDYTTRGNLFLMGLNWLPDSSGFLTVQSYLGDGAEGSGSVCIFNYSRLRHYTIQASN